MTRILSFGVSCFSNYLRKTLPVRKISTSRNLLSQEWQQEGVPGSNLPFSIGNKYKLTLLFYLYFGSGLAAPFILLAITLKRIYTPAMPIGEQVLTTVYCPEGAQDE